MLVRYDVIPQGGGWSIAMGGAVGPPYLTLADALRNTAFMASTLKNAGDDVVIWLWDEAGNREICDTRRNFYAEVLLRLRSQ